MPTAQRRSRAYCVVLTTCADRRAAGRLADALLDRKLAGCAQLVPIESRYDWKGRRERSREVLVLLKARRSSYARLEAAIRSLHDYEVPQVVRLDIARGAPAYLGWLGSVTR